MRSVIIALVLATFATPALAQYDRVNASPAEPLTFGQTFTIGSRVLDETRRINVWLPPVYADSSGIRLPVLYMPDGGMAEDFLHVAGLMQISILNGTMRPFLLVGIENTQRRRDMTGPTRVANDSTIAPMVGGSAAFRRFIRDELMPIVNERYRTTAETAIVGESLAGLFIVETFFLEPDLFDTYIAFDPSLWWNDARLVKDAPEALRRMDRRERTLYLASSSEPELADLAKQLVAALAMHAPLTLAWTYTPMPAETHATIYDPAAMIAFRKVFAPVPAPHG
jgi:hypothetical protein